MRFRIVIGILLFLISDRSEGATEASCRVSSGAWSRCVAAQDQYLLTCFLDISEVGDKDFTISPPTGQTVQAIEICYKPGLKFLPTKLLSALPDLILFRVIRCSVKSVNKNHFEKLSKLKYLDLYVNEIETISSDAFVDLVSLEVLDLHNNKIQILDEKTFAALKALKELNLSFNKIKFLDENIFSSLINLEKIDLSKNELQGIPKKLFKNNLKLKTVRLSYNKIKCSDFNIFAHLSELDDVDLRSNLCIDSKYNARSFDAMKRDLKQNCFCADSCGVPKHSSGLIVRGQSFQHGAFPWIVALMLIETRPPKFFCAGTLISKTFAVSAAHCILQKGAKKQFLARDILALFGAHDLNNPYEAGRILQSPKKVFIHDDWNHMISSYDADISLLEFEDETIQFNNFIQPICLWDSETEPTVTEGVVTGWGRSEDKSRKHENLPKLVSAVMQPNEDCFLEKGKLLALSSKRTFCAGLRNGSGVCSGDSGGGLFVKIDDVYHLKGIVSSSLIADNECDVSSNAVYTNVLKFKDWIKSKIEDEGGD